MKNRIASMEEELDRVRRDSGDISPRAPLPSAHYSEAPSIGAQRKRRRKTTPPLQMGNPSPDTYVGRSDPLTEVEEGVLSGDFLMPTEAAPPAVFRSPLQGMQKVLEDGPWEDRGCPLAEQIERCTIRILALMERRRELEERMVAEERDAFRKQEGFPLLSQPRAPPVESGGGAQSLGRRPPRPAAGAKKMSASAGERGKKKKRTWEEEREEWSDAEREGGDVV